MEKRMTLGNSSDPEVIHPMVSIRLVTLTNTVAIRLLEKHSLLQFRRARSWIRLGSNILVVTWALPQNKVVEMYSTTVFILSHPILSYARKASIYVHV
jgi:hypothetical protein